MLAEIELRPEEWYIGAYVGFRRHAHSLYRRNARALSGDSRDGWDMHIQGAMAEMALAKYLGRFWALAREPDRTGGDVGPGIDVKWSRRADARLLVQRDDATDATYWLVTGGPPMFAVRGCITGGYAKQDKWWCEPVPGRPCFAVPQGELLDA